MQATIHEVMQYILHYANNMTKSKLLVILRVLVNNRATYYSPVQGSCTAGDGIATLIINNTVPAEPILESSKPFQLLRNNITLGSILLEGTFGSNYTAILHLPGDARMEVVIKTVKGIPSLLFYLNFSYFCNLTHFQITQLKPKWS